MIVNTRLQFRARREPYDYDMSNELDRDGRPGPAGTSYSIDVMDDDDAKGKVKVSEETWKALADAKRGDWLVLPLEVGTPRVPKGAEVKLEKASPVPAAARG